LRPRPRIRQAAQPMTADRQRVPFHEENFGGEAGGASGVFVQKVQVDSE